MLAAHFSEEQFKPVQRSVVSTISGKQLSADSDLPTLLCQQLTSPVCFMDAVNEASSEKVDLWLEVGPGRVLQGIMEEITDAPVISLDAGGESLKGLLCATGAAFVLGQPIDHEVLFAGRFTKPFNLDWRPKFLVNPCELAPVLEAMPASIADEEKKTYESLTEQETARPKSLNSSALDVVRELVAKRAELPISVVGPESRMLSDLHLNSITVGQLITEATHLLQLPRPFSPTDFADARVQEIADAFAAQQSLGPRSRVNRADELPAGLDSWVRSFHIELVERSLPERRADKKPGRWQVLSTPDDPFAESLKQAFARSGSGSGIVLCVAEDTNLIVRQLLAAARMVLLENEKPRFVLVQRGRGAAAFARTLHLEASEAVTCVINLPRLHPNAVDWVVAEAIAAEGYVEVHYDELGRRYARRDNG
jgi:enediyne polyketide synthase